MYRPVNEFNSESNNNNITKSKRYRKGVVPFYYLIQSNHNITLFVTCLQDDVDLIVD